MPAKGKVLSVCRHLWYHVRSGKYALIVEIYASLVGRTMMHVKARKLQPTLTMKVALREEERLGEGESAT